MALITFLSKTTLIKMHATKAKIFMILFTFLGINYLNHWLPAFGGVAFYILFCAIISKFFEEKSGLSYYLSQSQDIEFIRRIDALKIIVLGLVSSVFILIFSKIDPIRMIYLSGR